MRGRSGYPLCSRASFSIVPCVLFLLWASFVVSQPGQVVAAEEKEMTVIFMNGRGNDLCRFRAEIATTPAEQERGLMFRKDLPTDSGMLFLGSGNEMRSFWMKNTYISLDLIFIDGNNEVKYVHHGAKPFDLSSISSRFPVQYVLEVNAGSAKKCRIGPGVKTRFVY